MNNTFNCIRSCTIHIIVLMFWCVFIRITIVIVNQMTENVPLTKNLSSFNIAMALINSKLASNKLPMVNPITTLFVLISNSTVISPDIPLIPVFRAVFWRRL